MLDSETLDTLAQPEKGRATTFLALIWEAAAECAWQGSIHPFTLPDKFALGLQTDTEKARKGLEECNELWNAIEKAEGIVDTADKRAEEGLPPLPEADAVKVSNLKKIFAALGFNRHQLVREGIKLIRDNEFNPKDADVQYFLRSMFEVPGNTKYRLEDAGFLKGRWQGASSFTDSGFV